MKLGVCHPTYCYELKYPLDTIYKINKFKIPYKNGCGGHISSPSYIETSYDKIENICKLTIGSILRALDIHDKHSADYYSRRDGECLQSPLFGILPSEGTYLINYEYFEIKDDCWSHVIPISGHVYDYHLYTLKDTSKNKNILKLTPEDFELVHKKQINKPYKRRSDTNKPYNKQCSKSSSSKNKQTRNRNAPLWYLSNDEYTQIRERRIFHCFYRKS